ncbi:outer membrane protein assembly factor BamB family protein [Nocardiopsis flavescens]
MHPPFAGRRLAATAAAVALAAACSAEEPASTTGHSVAQDPPDPDRPEAVAGVAWTREGWSGTPAPVFPVPGGVAVLEDEGVAVLSGETGEELWHYRVDAGELGVLADVADDGRHIVVEERAHDAGWTDPANEPDGGYTELVVLDSRTGAELDRYPVSDTYGRNHMERRSPFPGHHLASLGAFDGDVWVFRQESSLVARHAGGERTAWAVPTEDLAECGALGTVDDVVVTGGVAVAAADCSGPGRDGHTPGSHLVGLDAATGEELWRVTAAPLGPSVERLLAVHGGLVVDGVAGARVRWAVDPATGEAVDLGGGAFVGAGEAGAPGSDGAWRGLMGGRYTVRDTGGEVLLEAASCPARGAPSPLLGERPLALGLSGGVVCVFGEGEHDALAVFSGPDGTREIRAEGLADAVVHAAAAVPGAVVLSYTGADGRTGVVGLR